VHTPEQQIVHIEAALRQRFFAYVSKIEIPERTNWTQEQHDTDRLSRALAAYVLVGMVGLDDVSAAGAVTDGKDDRGIDALHYDRAGARLILVQSKFKKTGAAPSQEEAQKTINGVRALIQKRFSEFNAAFQLRLDEIEEALDTPGVSIAIVLTFLGDTCGSHATQDMNAFRAEINTLSERLDWQVCGRARVFDWLIAEEAPVSVTAEVTLENWYQVQAPRKAVYGQISARSVAQLVETHGKALFERNIRHYLGSIGVNNAIADTVQRKPEEFFYLNNGLTAVAERIIPAVGTNALCKFRLENVSIVNGAQTAGSISTASIDHELSLNAKVLLTIIEIGCTPDDIGLRITRARNHQNVVRGVDFAALDPTQERLRRELALGGINYHYRPSADARVGGEDSFTLEQAAVALACLSGDVFSSDRMRELRTQGHSPANAVDFVVTAKKEVGKLWEQEGVVYGKLFSKELTGIRLCRIVRVYRFIDVVLAATEWSENSYARRMFFRHGRYFVMAFVAQRCLDVLQRADFRLSPDDRQALSIATNEMAEVIYAESQSLQALKGYLAIFRNLTDSQPLADRVLMRLDQQKKAATVPRVPSPQPQA